MLKYLLAIPAIAVAYYCVYMALAGAAIAIGDSGNPVLSVPHGVALSILSFPMMTLWSYVGGDWIKQYIGDNATMFLFTGINGVLWGALLTFLVKLRFNPRG